MIVAYLRNSENAERFASVAATLPPAGVAAALAEVVKATGAAATPAKAAWVVASPAALRRRDHRARDARRRSARGREGR